MLQVIRRELAFGGCGSASSAAEVEELNLSNKDVDDLGDVGAMPKLRDLNGRRRAGLLTIVEDEWFPRFSST